MTTQAPPRAEFEILHSVRLTGRINNGLEIVTVRDNTEEVAELCIVADTPISVRLELYDFPEYLGSGETVTWEFVTPDESWQREAQCIVRVFDMTTNGEWLPMTLTARPRGSTSTEAEQEETKPIHIEIKPVVDSPDPT